MCQAGEPYTYHPHSKLELRFFQMNLSLYFSSLYTFLFLFCHWDSQRSKTADFGGRKLSTSTSLHDLKEEVKISGPLNPRKMYCFMDTDSTNWSVRMKLLKWNVNDAQYSWLVSTWKVDFMTHMSCAACIILFHWPMGNAQLPIMNAPLVRVMNMWDKSSQVNGSHEYQETLKVSLVWISNNSLETKWAFCYSASLPKLHMHTCINSM